MSQNNITSHVCNYFIVDHNDDRNHSAKAEGATALLNYLWFKS